MLTPEFCAGAGSTPEPVPHHPTTQPQIDKNKDEIHSGFLHYGFGEQKDAARFLCHQCLFKI